MEINIELEKILFMFFNSYDLIWLADICLLFVKECLDTCKFNEKCFVALIGCTIQGALKVLKTEIQRLNAK